MLNYGRILSKEIREEKHHATTDPKQKLHYYQKEDADYLFHVKFKDIDRFGIVVDYISIAKTRPVLDVGAINRRLDEQAEAIQKRVTFLLEEFKLIEMDRQNKCAQLRSYPPHKADNAKYYYEIMLDEGNKAHFQRYQYSIQDKRYEKITSQFTTETFERLVDELVKIIA